VAHKHDPVVVERVDHRGQVPLAVLAGERAARRAIGLAVAGELERHCPLVEERRQVIVDVVVVGEAVHQNDGAGLLDDVQVRGGIRHPTGLTRRVSLLVDIVVSRSALSLVLGALDDGCRRRAG